MSYRIKLRALFEENRFSKLHQAVRRNDSSAVERIVCQPNTDVNKINFGLSPLNLAIYFKNIAMVRQLLLIPWIKVNKIPELMYSPLVLAVEMESLQIVELLLGHKNIDVNCEEHSATPFEKACQLGNKAIVERLLQCEGLDTTRTERSAGYTISHIVCRYGSISVIDVLVRHKIFTLSPHDSEGNNPVQEACVYGQLAVVEHVLHNIAQIDKTMGSNAEFNGLYYVIIVVPLSKY